MVGLPPAAFKSISMETTPDLEATASGGSDGGGGAGAAEHKETLHSKMSELEFAGGLYRQPFKGSHVFTRGGSEIQAIVTDLFRELKTQAFSLLNRESGALSEPNFKIIRETLFRPIDWRRFLGQALRPDRTGTIGAMFIASGVTDRIKQLQYFLGQPDRLDIKRRFAFAAPNTHPLPYEWNVMPHDINGTWLFGGSIACMQWPTRGRYLELAGLLQTCKVSYMIVFGAPTTTTRNPHGTREPYWLGGCLPGYKYAATITDRPYTPSGSDVDAHRAGAETATADDDYKADGADSFLRIHVMVRERESGAATSEDATEPGELLLILHVAVDDDLCGADRSKLSPRMKNVLEALMLVVVRNASVMSPVFIHDASEGMGMASYLLCMCMQYVSIKNGAPNTITTLCENWLHLLVQRSGMLHNYKQWQLLVDHTQSWGDDGSVIKAGTGPRSHHPAAVIAYNIALNWATLPRTVSPPDTEDSATGQVEETETEHEIDAALRAGLGGVHSPRVCPSPFKSPRAAAVSSPVPSLASPMAKKRKTMSPSASDDDCSYIS
jgi:hypothetical protein